MYWARYKVKVSHTINSWVGKCAFAQDQTKENTDHQDGPNPMNMEQEFFFLRSYIRGGFLPLSTILEPKVIQGNWPKGNFMMDKRDCFFARYPIRLWNILPLDVAMAAGSGGLKKKEWEWGHCHALLCLAIRATWVPNPKAADTFWKLQTQKQGRGNINFPFES